MTTYDDAIAILNNCHNSNHANRDIHMGQGDNERVVCQDCHLAYHAAYKAARKAELAAWKQTLPTCQRCGKPHSARWRVWGWRLCGRCKTKTIAEHHENVGGNIVLGMMAGPCVVTTDWHYRKSNG